MPVGSSPIRIIVDKYSLEATMHRSIIVSVFKPNDLIWFVNIRYSLIRWKTAKLLPISAPLQAPFSTFGNTKDPRVIQVVNVELDYFFWHGRCLLLSALHLPTSF